MSVKVSLLTPADTWGKLISWRLLSKYCHAVIEIDGVVYSATMPDVVGLPPDSPDVCIPPRGGVSYEINLTPDQKAKALAYCKSMVGTHYDVLSVVGWALGIQWIRNRKRVYCFEYVADALAAAGVLPWGYRLITGDQLLVVMWIHGVIKDSDTVSHSFRTMSQQAVYTKTKAPVADK